MPRRLKVRFKGDRHVVRADSAFDLVGKLNNSSLQPERDRTTWMKRAAERASLQTGRRIRHDTARHFLTDLTKAGVITKSTRSREGKTTMRTPYLDQFTMQRLNAKRRGIPFLLTFEQWLTIWKRSGKLAKRGRKSDCYVMARFGDQGAYELGNVRIISRANNNREFSLGRRASPETRAKLSAAKTGKPRPDVAERNRSAGMRQKVSASWADREPRIGWHHTLETRRKISISVERARERRG